MASLARCSVEQRKAVLHGLSARVGNQHVTRMIIAIEDQATRCAPMGKRATVEPPTLARAPKAPSEAGPSSAIAQIAHDAIEELDGRMSKKVLIALVLAANKLSQLREFTAILKASKPKNDFDDYFMLLISEMNQSWGSATTVNILVLFADAGVNVTQQLTPSGMQELAAVAKFKSFVKQIRYLVDSGDLSTADSEALRAVIADAEIALREIEHPPKKIGVNVKLAGGIAGAAGTMWTAAAALAADDVTVIGVADDIAIPFVIVGAATLSAIALVTAGPKPQILDYGPAKAPVEAALRKMTDLVAISKAMAIQGRQATGQLAIIAIHLARLLAVASVGGQPPGEDPKKNKDNDKHWWTEIKAAAKNFFQATKGASRKQIMRELLKAGYTEAEIAEIEAHLLKAEQLMAEQIGRPLIPPP
jgi:hypothetical protein